MTRPTGGYLLQAVWASLGQIVQVVIAFVSLATLARILGAEAYGLYAVALMCVGLADLLVGGHAGQGLVSIPALRSTHSSSLFWVLVAVACFTGLGLWFGRDLISSAIGVKEAAAVVGYSCGLPLISAMTTVPSQLLVREVRFDALSRGSATGALIGAFAGIAAALAGLGPASLVVMEYVRRLTILGLAFKSASWFPKSRFDRDDVIQILRPAFRRIENQSVQYFSTNFMPRAIIAALLGPVSLGIYVIATRFIDQLNSVLSGPISGVALPAFAKARDTKDELVRILLKAIRGSTIAYWPALLGAAIVAPLAIPILFGSEMAPAAPIVQLMIIGSLRTPLSGFTNALFVGLDDHNAITRLQLISLFVGGFFLVLGSPWGLEGMTLGLALRQWFMWPIAAKAIDRSIGVGPGTQFMTMLQTATAPCLMALAVLLLAVAWPFESSPSLKLLTLIVTGLAAYPVALMMTSRSARLVIPDVAALMFSGKPAQAFRRGRDLFW